MGIRLILVGHEGNHAVSRASVLVSIDMHLAGILLKYVPTEWPRKVDLQGYLQGCILYLG